MYKGLFLYIRMCIQVSSFDVFSQINFKSLYLIDLFTNKDLLLHTRMAIKVPSCNISPFNVSFDMYKRLFSQIRVSCCIREWLLRSLHVNVSFQICVKDHC